MKNTLNKICIILCTLIILSTITTGCGETEVSGISFDNPEIVMEVGSSTNIVAVVQPENAKNKKLKWSSSNNAVVQVDNGTLKAKNKGKAVITAMVSNGVKQTCKVTVNDISAESIRLNKTSVSLKPGKEVKLYAKVYPVEASESVTWTSSDESVAFVDNNGKVIAVKAGNATISCTTNNKLKATCLIKVKKFSKPKSTTVTVTEPKPTYYQKPQGEGQVTGNIPYVDVASEVSKIRNLYYTTQNNPGKCYKYSDRNVYKKNGVTTKIVVKKGTYGWNYSREYYYNNGNLYFAFLKSGSKENRLYFSEGNLIRYIDESRVTQDYPVSDCSMVHDVFNEAFEVYE